PTTSYTFEDLNQKSYSQFAFNVKSVVSEGTASYVSPASEFTKASVENSNSNNVSINTINSESQITETYYDLMGRRVYNPTKGIFVVKRSDGTSIKRAIE
ncbi:MAG: hypothetical protein ACI4BH_10955, partial [Muribaculaceae bacterium]